MSGMEFGRNSMILWTSNSQRAMRDHLSQNYRGLVFTFILRHAHLESRVGGRAWESAFPTAPLWILMVPSPELWPQAHSPLLLKGVSQSAGAAITKYHRLDG